MQNAGQTIFTRKALWRVVYAVSLIICVMIIGIAGFHYIEGMTYINVLYFESMLATGQGPPLTLNTDSGKLFASIMAFVSVGSILTTLVYTLGPVLASVWRETLERAQVEAKKIEAEIDPRERMS